MTLASRSLAADAGALALDARALALDARALASLDQGLALDAAARSAWLAALAVSDPALHARVLRLLVFCPPHDSTGSTGQAAASRAVAGPLLAGLRQATGPGLAPGQELAGWRLLRELGRGGMSVVWLAERADGGVKRQVALKLPLAVHLSAVLAERFARERDVLAQLVHPHIARLYDAGVAENGQPFLVLEHVSGLPITQFADERHLGLRQRLQLFAQVLTAVDHAHRHLVVHRDLKPANILVDDDGQVKLLDFGIAKLLDAPADAAQLTLEAGAVMTPRYAAPEQVAGQAISTATDVYAAGAVLYELLTGRPPHPGTADDAAAPAAAMARLAQAVLHEAPPPPSQAALDRQQRRLLTGDIDTVVLTALRKAPAERYPSAERFAEDLRRLLADEPVLARRVPLWHRVRLLVRRHRRVTVVAALAGVLLLGVAALALQQWQDSGAQRLRADAVRDFMFQMVSDAEADETQAGAEVTGRQMVAAAVQRARQEMAGQPVLQGELLGELGRMQARLRQPEVARATLAESLGLLDRHVSARDPARNKVRAHLANALAADAPDRAQALATAAVQGCSARTVVCAQARNQARLALVQIANGRGQDDAALPLARLALADAEQGFGLVSPDTVDTLTQLGSLARNTGRLDEARQAFNRAHDIAGQLRLRQSQRIVIRRSQALVLLDMGQAAAARALFQSLLPETTDAYERGQQWHLLGKAEWALGNLDAAAHAAAQSESEARQAQDSLGVLLAQQSAARLQLQRGEASAALARLLVVRDALVADGQTSASLYMLDVGRLITEAQLQLGDLATAEAGLSALQQAVQEGGHGATATRADLAELAAALALRQGRATQAVALLRTGQTLLQTQLPADHPRLLRQAVLLARAQWLAGTGDALSLRNAAARYAAGLPDGSAWHAGLAALTTAPAGAAAMPAAPTQF